MRNLKYLFLVAFLKSSAMNIQINFLKIIGSVSKSKEYFYHTGNIGRLTHLKPKEPIRVELEPGTKKENWNGNFVAFIRDGHIVKIHASKLLD